LIDVRISQASAQLAAAKRSETKSRRALSQYALNAYINGGSGSVDLAALLDTNGSQIGQRQGYQSTAVGNRQELVDSLQASQRITADRAAALAVEQKNAADVAARAEAKRAAADAAAKQLQSIQSQLKGKLAVLVAQKQAAEQAAQEAQARAAAQAMQERARANAATPPPTQSVTTPSVTTGPAQSSNPTPPASSNPGSSNVPIVPSSGGGGAAVAAAMSQLGVPYVWGGASPSGFDCSGLTMWAWAHAGVSLSHYTFAQEGQGQVVPISQLQPGDLVFYYGGDHVAMYIGGGMVVHAPHTGDVVRTASLYMSTPDMAVRPG
ncbi:MAG: C40 family peptidase, partial [Actinobacteria bacterium]|nr:C40 family peptidase [Actinomycetota bacterium]